MKPDPTPESTSRARWRQPTQPLLLPATCPGRSARLRVAVATGSLILASACFAWPAPAAQAVPPAGAQATPPPEARLVPQASLDEMLRASPAPDWRWWRYRDNPAILVIEFPNLREQGMAMNRLAAMFEKRGGRRDRLLSDAEMTQLLQRSGDSVASFYEGHDYPGFEPARFFSLAAAQRTALNPQEERLRRLLIDAAVIQPLAGGGYIATGPQAVISFTAAQPDLASTPPKEQVDARRRAAVLVHELSHGEFYTRGAYRAYCLDFWRHGLTDAQRRTFRRYLESIDYDPTDEELMANETQAFLVHTPDPRAFNAAALGMSDEALDALRARFRARAPALGPAGREAQKNRP